ncbi:hypothetical protein C0991_010520 [Blastosporella zonata]|nr:hypothetical protein C0991_010520 [Blastosporella zonata]
MSLNTAYFGCVPISTFPSISENVFGNMLVISNALNLVPKNRYVGQDLIDPRRTKRTVQYRNPEDVWQYIGGGKRLAAQSNGHPGYHIHGLTLRLLRYAPRRNFLTITKNPLALIMQELQVDAARQQRVQANVALIEARDREERAMVLQLQQHQSGAATIEPPQESDITATTHTQEARQQPQVDPVPKNTLPKMATSADPYEPEPWTPRARARR